TGNSRWVPYDLESVVRVMKRELQGGEGFNYRVGSIRAVHAKQFRSLSAMKDSAENVVSEETMKKLKEEVDAEFMKLANDLSEYYRYDANRFGYLDQVSESFQELAKY